MDFCLWLMLIYQPYFPIKYRKAVLLASAVFCGMISLYYLGFMLMYAAVNYFSGIAVEKYKGRRIAYLPAVIQDSHEFFDCRSVSGLRGFLRSERSCISPDLFPIGISFLTLSAIGYIVDVKGVIAAERDFSMIALYFIFFRDIHGSCNALPKVCKPYFQFEEIQLQRHRSGTYDSQQRLCQKKVILADNLFMLSNGC